MRNQLLATAVALLLAGAVGIGAAVAETPPPAGAEPLPDPAADEAAIRDRFDQWTEDFNARRYDRLCDFFAADAIGENAGRGPRDRDTICDDLARLSESSRSYRYDLALREIAVFGDMAVARPTWRLTVSGGGLPGEVTVDEIGLDVLRRDPDGRWRIVRFFVYDEPRP